MNPGVSESPSAGRPSASRLMKTFAPGALEGLEPTDRFLFQTFGQGPKTEVPFARIHHAFEMQASRDPNAIAAEHLDASITYGELDRQAELLADFLERAGVGPGDNVALFLERSIPMLVGIMGVLKAGAAYVPQHVGVAPREQLEHVIDMAGIRIILTLSSLANQIPVPPGGRMLCLDEFMAGKMPGAAASDPVMLRRQGAFAIRRSLDNACFVLFTSGTTGKPNGVRVTHRNVCNILLTDPGNLGMRPGLKVAQILSIAFDMAAWEILGCLAHGATLIIRGRNIAEAARKANVIIATPSILAGIDVRECPEIKCVAVAGEPCPRPLADAWAAACTFYNSCGPTEVTIVNTMQRHSVGAERLTIGKPTPNNTVYILDENLRPCRIGEVGEMWAGGDCVSAGYLHNDELNNERYRLDPFLGNGRRMFRTRDLGRWTADGELEHFGRTDDQVKIRGFRVELDSVSAVLESVPLCQQAVTLKLNDRNLVAFVSPQDVDVEAARQAVARTLPYYCTPAMIIPIDGFPVTSRGKIDKRALTALAVERLDLMTKAEVLL